jgi:hypothetical protein
MRWSRFSPGGYQGYLQEQHRPLIVGSFTFAGQGVYGPGDRGGNPRTDHGRNVLGVLTQPPNGSF